MVETSTNGTSVKSTVTFDCAAVASAARSSSWRIRSSSPETMISRSAPQDTDWSAERTPASLDCRPPSFVVVTRPMSATSLSAGIGRPAETASPLGRHRRYPGGAHTLAARTVFTTARASLPRAATVRRVPRVAGTHVPAQRGVVDGAHASSAHTDLAGTPHAAPLARIFIREHLRNQVPPDVLETTMLLTTELVTNVVLHAKTSIHLGITWDEHNQLVTVQDHNLQTPGDRHQLDGDRLRETGRGLMVVESLADDFGWYRLASEIGKVMWFSLAI